MAARCRRVLLQPHLHKIFSLKLLKVSKRQTMADENWKEGLQAPAADNRYKTGKVFLARISRLCLGCGEGYTRVESGRGWGVIKHE